VGSKSSAEVSAYVGVLEEATAMQKSSQQQRHRFARVLAAVKVDEQWLAFEERVLKVLHNTIYRMTTSKTACKTTVPKIIWS
jgi:hypothetical protein